jgi:hypothetical protein
MNKLVNKLNVLLLIPIIFGLYCCAGGNYGKLIKTDQPSEKELRQNWRDYTVYYNSDSALIYKMNNDRDILLSKRWVEVTSEEMMAESKIFDFTQVVKILGPNDTLYGYLVRDYDDRASVKIIDERTIHLYYYPTRIGGP